MCQLYRIREESEVAQTLNFITYGGWEVRDGRDKNVAAWNFKPIKGD